MKLRVETHKARVVPSRFKMDSCHSFASCSDNDSGEDESYGASNSMELETPTSTETEETTRQSNLDHQRALKKSDRLVRG